MKWKTLFWTAGISVFIFFLLVYFGMKYQWVQALQDKKTLENEKVTLEIPENDGPEAPVKPELLDEKAPASVGNDPQANLGVDQEANKPKGFEPSLLGEETDVVDFTGMPLELVVEECRRISTKVGVPEERFNQSVNECAARNFQGKATEDSKQARIDQAALRKQCKQGIPDEQQALLAPEEMKLLIDECVLELKRKQ